MKRLTFIILVSLININLFSQETIFILVDVSRSISNDQLSDAKQALIEVLTGSPLSEAFVSQGNINDLNQFILSINDKISIDKFGDIQNTQSIKPDPVQIKNLPTDILNVMSSFPVAATDDRTYITLAKAKIAEFAKQNKILRFKFCLVSDNIQDDYGPDGIPNYPTEYIKNLAEGYNSTDNPVSEAPFTKIKFSSASFFTLSFSPVFDVSNYIPPPGGIIIEDNLKTIELTSYKGGTTQNPIVIKDDNFTISWFCKDAPDNASYKVNLSPINQSGVKRISTSTSGNSCNFKDINSGKWRVTVSSANQSFQASSTSTTIKLKNNSSIFLLWLLIIVISGGGAYWYWHKKREEKLDKLKTSNEGDNNSSGSVYDM